MSVELLGGVLKRIGTFNPTRYVASFVDRLIVQKEVYLLERAFDVDLAYPFRLYLRGPYSPDLSREAYQLDEKLYPTFPPLKFTDPAINKRFDDYLNFLEPHEADEKWLEVAANMVWFWRHGLQSYEKLQARLTRKDEAFTSERCRPIFDELLEKGLLSVTVAK